MLLLDLVMFRRSMFVMPCNSLVRMVMYYFPAIQTLVERVSVCVCMSACMHKLRSLEQPSTQRYLLLLLLDMFVLAVRATMLVS